MNEEVNKVDEVVEAESNVIGVMYPYMPPELQTLIMKENIDISCPSCGWTTKLVYKVINAYIERNHEWTERSKCGPMWHGCELSKVRSKLMHYYQTGEDLVATAPTPEWAKVYVVELVHGYPVDNITEGE